VTGSDDPTLGPVNGFLEALERLDQDRVALMERLVVLREERLSGTDWGELLGSDQGSGTMQMVSELLAGMSEASGALRKSVVEELRREQVSIPKIAKLLGVTHQRVSNLLRRPAGQGEEAGRAAHEEVSAAEVGSPRPL
jgi:hypothetical protein